MRQKLEFDHKKVKYLLKQDGKFIIENYNFSKPFSSFFPGIAGLYGIPMWVFYVNRGQGICSFGTNSKERPILEFLSANKAYQMVFWYGFRTFIKIKDKNKIVYYEPFENSLNNLKFNRRNRLLIDYSDLGLEEENSSLGLKINVDYFTIPSDNFAALARILTITNTSKHSKSIELIDGLPIIIPYGLSNMFLKKLSRTIEAWMGVENLENNAAFYRLKVDPTDRPEIIHIEKGNFFLSFYQNKNKAHILKPIVDPQCVFGRIGDLSLPFSFLNNSNFEFPKKQIVQSKTPCAFSFTKFRLEKNKQFKLYSIFGNMSHLDKLNRNIHRIASVDYLNDKQKENGQILNPIMQNAATVSRSLTFNLYARRTFLDNLLRGGLPITLDKETEEIVYVYSRKHGDLERDYNKFVTQPTYFSQGDGNYRDINQNRRNDIFFNTELKDSNIITFFNLIQLDGFNPLVVKGRRYHLEDKSKIENILHNYTDECNRDLLGSFLSKPFYIGELFIFLEEHNIKIKQRDDFIKKVIDFSIKHQEAEHKEGFWTDHWTYNLDQLERFLDVYPDRLKDILLDKKEFTFYDDGWVVNPRHKKYILYDGKPKQLNSVAFCKEKQQLIELRHTEPNTIRTQLGKGAIYKTNLLEKFICIIINKLASLDPFGVGIEMEANKPNWYDALNGLPALFGSSISETMELKRWIVFLKDALSELKLSQDFSIELAEEIFNFYNGLNSLLLNQKNDSQDDNFIYWDKSYSLKEEFRKETVFGLNGKKKQIRLIDFKDFLNRAQKKLENAITKSYNHRDRTYTTYFINEVIKYECIGNDKGCVFIKPLKFRQRPLPLFLEGFVHALRIADRIEDKKSIVMAVRNSRLYDKVLGMYKVNAPLQGEPEEIGRTRAFTPGWLENESVWLHMEYKYLLELLEGGLYDEFYRDFFKILIPFQDPQRYGRSILENSSFIVSSVFPDDKLHGNGFVARLSGSTSEFLHIWLLMNIGNKPFFMNQENKLCLRFNPILHRELFTRKKQKLPIWINAKKEIDIDKNCYAFNFLGGTLVVYHNPKRIDTYGHNAASIRKIILENQAGKKTEIDSNLISQDYSYDVRLGRFSRIDIHLS